MAEQPCLVEHVGPEHDGEGEPVGDDHAARRVPEPAMAAAVGAV
jgi:hypothetical protein